MDEVRIGIIGVGNMGSGHAANITAGKVKGMKLVAIADISETRREWAKTTYPDVRIFETAEAMIDSGLINAVIIAVPHYFHPVYALYALKRDINVMCEKPAGVYTKSVREVNEYAKTCKATYAIMFNQRTNCVYRKMKEIVESGELGRIRRTNWIITNWYRPQSYYDSGSWRATWDGEGGGVLLNQCPHNLDLWQWICGMPKTVRAFTYNGKWHDIEVEDDVTAFVEYENGATGTFITTTGDTPGTNRFEITLDGGKLVCENDKLLLYRLKMSEPEFTKTYKGGFGDPGYTLEEVETDGLNEQHVGVLQAFADHLIKGEPLVAEGYEGINGLTISNAMHLSSWTDTTVTLPIDEDKFLEELNKRRATSKAKKNVTAKTLDTEGTY